MDVLKLAWEIITSLAVLFYYEVARLMVEYPSLSSAVFVAIAVGIIGVFYLKDLRSRRRKFRLQRGRNMTRKERQKYLKDLMGGALTDLIEEWEYSGKVSRSEARMLYRKASQSFTIKALLPRQSRGEMVLTPEHLRNLKRVIFKEKPVNIPGPKPGEATTSNVIPIDAGRKKFGAGFLSRRQKTA